MHSDSVPTSSGETRDRKSTKPLMEKRRRARINASLTELKSLLLEVIKKEGARHSKMEKADILEMTVKHLKALHLSDTPGNTPALSSKHNLGFSECAQEVSRYLSTLSGCDTELRTRLLDHLANTVTGYDDGKDTPPPSSSCSSRASPRPTLPSSPPPLICAQPVVSTSHEEPRIPLIDEANLLTTDMNNNISVLAPQQPQQYQAANIVSGMQVIPTKLPTGKIAFVVPANILTASQTPNYVIPVYASHSSSPLYASQPSSQTKPMVAMTMSANNASQTSFMTLFPPGDLFQTCTVASLPININVVTSKPSTLSLSPGQASDSSAHSLSPPYRVPKSEGQPRDLSTSDNDIIRCIDVGQIDQIRLREVNRREEEEIRPRAPRDAGNDVVEDTDMWRPW